MNRHFGYSELPKRLRQNAAALTFGELVREPVCVVVDTNEALPGMPLPRRAGLVYLAVVGAECWHSRSLMPAQLCIPRISSR